MTSSERVMNVFEDLLREAVSTDGEHHKQWYLERIADLFGIQLPHHDQGIAP